MPDDQRELEAAWQALAERERRGEEATRQRASELEERSARVAALWEELGERSTELAAQEADLGEREQVLGDAAEDLRRREGLVQDAEARVEAGRRQLVELESMQAEVSARLIEVDERGEWVAATELQLAEREQRNVTEREQDLPRRLAELEAREAAVAALAPREPSSRAYGRAWRATRCGQRSCLQRRSGGSRSSSRASRTRGAVRPRSTSASRGSTGWRKSSRPARAASPPLRPRSRTRCAICARSNGGSRRHKRSLPSSTREAKLNQLSTELTERGAWLAVAEQGLGSREAQAADLEASVERRQRALDVRQTELERFEQSLNAREQALDSAEGDLEQRRRLNVGAAAPQATSA